MRTHKHDGEDLVEKYFFNVMNAELAERCALLFNYNIWAISSYYVEETRTYCRCGHELGIPRHWRLAE